MKEMRTQQCQLSKIAYLVTDKIPMEDVPLTNYVTTDSLLPNKKGRCFAQNLPPQKCVLTHYKSGDVLVANIRPYLKKIWLADREGGASADVLVFRARPGHSQGFIYASLLQDSFYDYAMKGKKGSKMPRGDKDQIMRYSIPKLSLAEEACIGNMILSFCTKINVNRLINDNLEAMARQLYDYWFVQFDFPNEEGKPYKSSGGAMVWNEKLKREIPQGWNDCILGEICDMYQPKTLGLNDLSEDSEYKVYGANGIIGHYSLYNHENSEIAMACRGNSCGTINRTSPKSWITGNAMVIKFRNKEIHNEYIKQALKYANVKGAISGSGQPQLTRENLSLLKMTQPNYAILEAFSKKVAAIVAMELEIEEQNDNLTKQRDELLPLLMSGQASVNSD